MHKGFISHPMPYPPGPAGGSPLPAPTPRTCFFTVGSYLVLSRTGAQKLKRHLALQHFSNPARNPDMETSIKKPVSESRQ